MEKIDRIAKGKRPVYFDEAIDMLLDANIAMAAEISVLQERLATLEAVSEQKGGFSAQDIEDYRPDAQEIGQRQEQRGVLISRIFGGFETALMTAARSHQAGGSSQ